MLGDLDGDTRWAAGDLAALARFLEDPFLAGDEAEPCGPAFLELHEDVDVAPARSLQRSGMRQGGGALPVGRWRCR
jgi:hypothetical protein